MDAPTDVPQTAAGAGIRAVSPFHTWQVGVRMNGAKAGVSPAAVPGSGGIRLASRTELAARAIREGWLEVPPGRA